MAVFPPHFELAERTGLPMYLHSRSTGGDFNRIIRENRHRFSGGVVHSFTGTAEELQEILALDLYVGINGCSLKT
jgi:TatD DNase family protein